MPRRRVGKEEAVASCASSCKESSPRKQSIAMRPVSPQRRSRKRFGGVSANTITPNRIQSPESSQRRPQHSRSLSPKSALRIDDSSPRRSSLIKRKYKIDAFFASNQHNHHGESAAPASSSLERRRSVSESDLERLKINFDIEELPTEPAIRHQLSDFLEPSKTAAARRRVSTDTNDAVIFSTASCCSCLSNSSLLATCSCCQAASSSTGGSAAMLIASAQRGENKTGQISSASAQRALNQIRLLRDLRHEVGTKPEDFEEWRPGSYPEQAYDSPPSSPKRTPKSSPNGGRRNRVVAPTVDQESIRRARRHRRRNKDRGSIVGAVLEATVGTLLVAAEDNMEGLNTASNLSLARKTSETYANELMDADIDGRPESIPLLSRERTNCTNPCN